MEGKRSTDAVCGSSVPAGLVKNEGMAVGRISGHFGHVAGEWPAAFGGCAWTAMEKARLFELLERIAEKV